MPVSNISDIEIRNAILATIAPVTDDALLLNRWILGLGLGESIPYLKVPATSKVHAYMVSRSATSRSKTKINAGQYFDVFTYKLWGFYTFRIGNNANNSEDDFSLELDNVYQVLADNPRLTFDNLETNLVEHQDWQIPEIDIYEFGTSKVHVAQGQIDVVLRVQSNG